MRCYTGEDMSSIPYEELDAVEQELERAVNKVRHRKVTQQSSNGDRKSMPDICFKATRSSDLNVSFWGRLYMFLSLFMYVEWALAPAAGKSAQEGESLN
jgi:hypothetical protein